MFPWRESRSLTLTKRHDGDKSIGFVRVMPLQYGNPVCSAQGSELGYVNFLAVSRETGDLRHFVVRLKNSPFPNKVLALDLIASISSGRITLNPKAGNLVTLPDFTVSEYVPLSIEDWNTFQRVHQILNGKTSIEKRPELMFQQVS
jgi:hypothetical protein